MTSLAFDTFENVKRLKAVDFTGEQAAIVAILVNNLYKKKRQ